MDPIVHFDKGRRWRSRAEQLRALAAATHERAVHDNLLAMAEAFEQYALKWEGTALVFRFAPHPKAASREARADTGPQRAVS
jgi:hypothetical protein